MWRICMLSINTHDNAGKNILDEFLGLSETGFSARCSRTDDL